MAILAEGGILRAETLRFHDEVRTPETIGLPEDAERWDLEFWQSVTPEERLSALVAIRRDVEAVVAGRDAAAEEP